MSRLRQLAVVVYACACVKGEPRAPVILISVDTLRADYLSCYRQGRDVTPHIDSLTRNGTLFSQVSALVPLTLPSHVAMLTSTYPFVNGIEDNGIPFGAGETLATVLKTAGYHTAAFVGGFVLDRRFGLSRGFDVYDSPFDLHRKTVADAGDLKRPGAQVAEAAMRWLDQNGNSPFFLFLHLYDLHTPYNLPSGAPRRGDAGYRAELAYVDGVVGDFLAYLERHGLLNKSLVVFTSDHGEGLGEHGETTHGYFVYESTLHVPLIIHWPQTQRPASLRRVDEPASLLDVAPTILDSLGLPRPVSAQGRSLNTAGASDRELFSESLYARNHFGCAPLRSLRAGHYKYIDAPTPELYDLSADPLESRNLYSSQTARAIAMRGRIVSLIAAVPAAKPRTPSPEAANALRSLGYLSGSTTSSRLASHIDPKDRIIDFERYGQALAMASAGRLAESSRLLSTLIEKLPDVVDIRIGLGLNDQQAGDYTKAAQEFQRVLETAPLSAQAHFDLAVSYFRLRRLDPATKELQAALALEPWYTRAEELLAQIYLETKDYSAARARLEHLLLIDPESYAAHYNLGVLAAMKGDWTGAQAALTSALHTDPSSAEAHNTLGSVFLRRGDLLQARAELEQAIKIEPRFAFAYYNLALVSKKEQKIEEAARELRAALKADPSFHAAQTELDRIESLSAR